MSTFPHSQGFLDEQRQKEQWRAAEKQIKLLQTEVAGGGSGFQPLDADLSDIADLDSSTAGMIASDGAGWVKRTYAQIKTALGLTKGDVGLGSVDNVQQLPLSYLDTDGTLAANSDSKVATQKAVKTFGDTMLPKAGGEVTGNLIVDGEFVAEGGKIDTHNGFGNISLDSGGYSFLIAGTRLSFTISEAVALPQITRAAGLSFDMNAGLTIDPFISGGEVCYIESGSFYFFDGGSSDRTVYVNAEYLYEVALGIFVNAGSTHNITIDADPAGVYYTMTPIVLAPGESAIIFPDPYITGTYTRIVF